ncbi:MAG: hypothetical protein Q9171_006277 [Xanthocarpia ochracea]
MGMRGDSYDVTQGLSSFLNFAETEWFKDSHTFSLSLFPDSAIEPKMSSSEPLTIAADSPAPPSHELAGLIDGKHYRARRHSIVHPTTVRLNPPSVLISCDLTPLPVKEVFLTTESHAANTLSTHNTREEVENSPADITHPHSEGNERSSFTAEDVQPFCNRDTVIYVPYPTGLNGVDSNKLWKEMYRVWYPHRGGDAVGDTGALRGGAFFAKFLMWASDQDIGNQLQMGDTGSQSGNSGRESGDSAAEGGTITGEGINDKLEASLSRLSRFHEQLCKTIEGVVGSGNGILMKSANPRESPVSREREERYRLTGTFSNCFLFIEDEEWQRNGVVLAWRGENVGSQMDDGPGDGLVTGLDMDVSRTSGTVGRTTQWRYRRMNLTEAMRKIMFAEDPGRHEGRVEGSAFWEKWYARGQSKDRKGESVQS